MRFRFWRLLVLTLLYGIFAIFLQGTLVKFAVPDMVVPNLLIVLIVYFAFYEATVAGAFLSFFTGCLFDLQSGLLLGAWAGSFTLVFGVFSSLSQRIFVDSRFAVFLVTLLSAVVSNLVYAVLIYEFRPMAAEMISISLGDALFTAVLAPFLLPLVIRFMKWGAGEGK